MKRIIALAAVSALLCVVPTSRPQALVPNLLNIQAFVTDNLGMPLDTTLDVTIKIYSDSTTPTPLSVHSEPSELITDGIVNLEVDLTILVPGVDLFQALSSESRWVGITLGTDPEISPRTQVVSVPYAFIAERLDGDLKTAPSVLIAEDATPLDAVETELQLSDLKVSLALDRATDSGRATLTAEGLTLSNYSSSDSDYLSIDPVSIRLGDPPPPSIVPPDPKPFISVADDIFGQIFAAMTEAGLMRASCVTCSLHSIMEPAKISLVNGSDTAKVELEGDILKFTPPASTGGLDLGGVVQVSNPKLISITTESDILMDTDGYVGIAGSTTGRAANITGDRLSINDSANGDALVLTDEEIRLGNAVNDSVYVRGDGGVTVISGVGLTSAIYNSNGVQLTGPGLQAYLANRSVTLYTASSGNDAARIRNDVFGGSLTCYDGVGGGDSASLGNSGLTVYSGATESARVGTSSTSFSVPVTHNQACTFNGTTDCRSSSSYDPNNDATPDVIIDATGLPALTVASGTDFNCQGLSTFGQPVQVNSDVTVTGNLTVLGVKAFAQDHPTDPAKRVIYVALEGGEAGTYSRGSGRLENGEAIIPLPEDFALVTGPEGLTAQITPRGPVRSMLYVAAVTPTELVVKASNPGDSDVPFDFTVNGVRLGFEHHQPIQDRPGLAMKH